MDTETISIVGKRKRYDYPIIPKKEYLTTQKIPIIREIYKKSTKDLHNPLKRDITTIGYLQTSRKRITQKEIKELKEIGVDISQINKYNFYAETSRIDTDIFVIAEPFKIKDSYLPLECKLIRLKDNVFYLKEVEPTYLKAEGLEIEKPTLNFSEILDTMLKYTQLGTVGTHIVRALVFPYIGCNFIKYIADGFGISQLAENKKEDYILEGIKFLHNALNYGKLGIPFNHFGILNLLGEKNINKVNVIRKELTDASYLSWTTPCNEKEITTLKMSELKFYFNEPLFDSWVYEDLKNNLDLRYSLLLYGLKQKEPVDKDIYYKGYKKSVEILEKYIGKPKEKEVICDCIIPEEGFPKLIGRCLSALSSVGIDEEKIIPTLKDIITKDIENIADKLLEKAKVSIKSREEADPKILLNIIFSEDKSEEGIIEAISKTKDWSMKRSRAYFLQLLENGIIYKGNNEYLLTEQASYNLKNL